MINKKRFDAKKRQGRYNPHNHVTKLYYAKTVTIQIFIKPSFPCSFPKPLCTEKPTQLSA